MKKLFLIVKSKVSILISLFVSICLFSHGALAKISTMTGNVSQDAGLVTKDFLFWSIIVAIIVFVTTIFNIISEKKKQQPLTWQGWALVCCILIPSVMYIMSQGSGTITGSDSTISLEKDRNTGSWGN